VSLEKLEARIRDLEVRIKALAPGLVPVDGQTHGCTHGCTGACPDPTGDCTYGCTYGCTQGCTEGCGEARPAPALADVTLSFERLARGG
jgi:hypothetical protein